MRDWGPLAVVAVLFLGFCVAFNSATPYRRAGLLVHQRAADGGVAMIPDVGAPDERQHANYIAGLLRGEGFPVLRPGDPNLGETYQSHQPPAYYLFATGWCKVLGIDPTDDNGGFGLRFLNTLIGLATLFGLYIGAKWVFGNTGVATAAAAFLLLPMSVALHSAASNDPLLICLCTWVMALLGLGLTKGWTTRTAVLVGLLTGVALLTKTTAIALLPCLVLALVFKKEGEDVRPKLAVWALTLALPLVIAAPWWARNMSLYGDPLAMKAFNAAFVGSPQASDLIAAVGAADYWSSMVLWWTARSAIGVFGYMDIFMFEHMNMDKSSAVYAAILFLLAVPVVAGTMALFAKPKEGDALKPPLWVWTVYFFLIVVLFVRFNMQYFQGQARYLYPAIAPVAWCGARGMFRLVRSNQTAAWATFAVFFTALDWFAYLEIVQGFAVRL